MPLITTGPPSPAINEEGTAIGFWMAETGGNPIQPIWVSVRSAALARVSPRRLHNRIGFQATCEKYRARIEMIASDHFDAVGPDLEGVHEGEPVLTIWSLDA
jgi:hypothetical protein